MDLTSFKKAFSVGKTVDLKCNCGRVFCSTYMLDEDDSGESSKEQPGVTFTEFDIDEIVFEGKVYSDYCDCWHERAKSIMGFLDSHHTKIANYLNFERQRKIEEAQNLAIAEQ